MKKNGKNRFAAAIFAVITMSFAGGSAIAGGLLDVEFDPADFAGFAGTYLIDNPYWPLNVDGQMRTFTYIGETEDECVINQVAYKGDTYTLMTADPLSPYFGFTALEIEDTEWAFEEFNECDLSLLPNDEAITELTLDWYAQDGQQNIWYMGEDSQSFEDDCGPYPGPADPDDECFEGSWEAGMIGGEGEDAVLGEAGIVVPGDEPIIGEPLTPGTFYLQEVAYEAEDMAKILRLNAEVSTDFFGEGEDCRKVKEWNPFEHGGSVEHKWYCIGPGLVLIEGVGGGLTEVEELIDISPPLVP